ncbi:MAG: hypothetical protein COV52_08135 [Gammaproteobacteria bacterium CG11_big_fil_rev_8_21_14_0_20_46_22]|nr:MAG: hypothetical protein COW05_00075 [Gammaproteobacteria bacterium CG12_big_fil_rev_8_21_14_0_65_46_12]PIR10632.1 MAG: hypothetical protein COV52_08135 [Gammaproteobacteria bacterium CG11_big_fil_rev_8_21_14_0_20_46_22]
MARDGKDLKPRCAIAHNGGSTNLQEQIWTPEQSDGARRARPQEGAESIPTSLAKANPKGWLKETDVAPTKGKTAY